jgi:hypothetical protein
MAVGSFLAAAGGSRRQQTLASKSAEVLRLSAMAAVGGRRQRQYTNHQVGATARPSGVERSVAGQVDDAEALKAVEHELNGKRR